MGHQLYSKSSDGDSVRVRLAQSVEHQAANLKIVGSSLTLAILFIFLSFQMNDKANFFVDSSTSSKAIFMFL